MALDTLRKSLQTLPLSRRIGVGYIALTSLTLVCGLAGGLGIWRLGELLNFVTGPAWDTADGAMEGSIEIEAQMIAARNLVDGIGVEDNQQRLSESQEGARVAFGRLTNAGLLPAERCREIQSRLLNYERQLSDLMKSAATLALSRQTYDVSAARMITFARQFSATENSLLTTLQSDAPDAEAESDGLSARSKLGRNAALTLSECYAQCAAVSQLMLGGDPGEFRRAFGDAKLNRQAALQQMQQTGLPEQRAGENLFPEEFAGRHIGEIFEELSSAFDRQAETQAVELAAQQACRRAYEITCEQFLDYIASVEEEADGTVENMTRSIAWNRMTAFAGIVMSLLAGLVISVVAGRLCTSSVTVPISAAMSVMQEHAHSNASAIQEMLASIDSIAGNTETAAMTSRNAADVARRGVDNVKGLGDAAFQISSIADLIQSIAEQTNLLALNATIEAARAGDAGKGFAVVAHEVKELARQTAAATGNINRQIQEVCSISQSAAQEISQIHEVILQVDEINQQIRSAVEQQNSTTHEISRSVMATADAAKAVVDAIGERQN